MTTETPGSQPEPITVKKTTPLPEPVAGLGRLEQDNRHSLYLARWSTRFWAWLVDFILIILFLNIIHGILQPIWIIPYYWDLWHGDLFEFGFQTMFFFHLLDDPGGVQGPVDRKDGHELKSCQPRRHENSL